MKKSFNLKPQSPAFGKTFNPAQYVKPGVTQAQVLQIKATFDLFDEDLGGSIDVSQLKAAMVSLGISQSNSTVCKILMKIDSDGSKKIQFNQWFDLMTYKLMSTSTKQSINKLFPLYDRQHTGFITIKDLKAIAKQLGHTITDLQLQQMIQAADLDKDGLVSQEQFYAILTKPLKQ